MPPPSESPPAPAPAATRRGRRRPRSEAAALAGLLLLAATDSRGGAAAGAGPAAAAVPGLGSCCGFILPPPPSSRSSVSVVLRGGQPPSSLWPRPSPLPPPWMQPARAIAATDEEAGDGAAAVAEAETAVIAEEGGDELPLLLQGLDEEQRAAVTWGMGPLRLLAGPGSGKTRVLTHRVAYLIKELGARPRQVLAVTFTIKAAREIKTRLKGLGVGGGPGGVGRSSSVTAGTFHSVCLAVLRQCPGLVEEAFGLAEGFTVFDESERRGLITGLFSDEKLTSKYEFLNRTAGRWAFLQARRAEFKAELEEGGIEEGDEEIKIEKVAELASTLISRYKNAGFFPADIHERAAVLEPRINGRGGGKRDKRWEALARWEWQEWSIMAGPEFFADVYSAYQEALRARNSADFDDLLLLTRELLQTNTGNLRGALQKRWRHVLVDEWQDTNRVQYDIVALLCTPLDDQEGEQQQTTPRSLMMVGDMDQSIYAFRGAQPKILERLQRDFPHCATLLLENNYRSTAPIAAAANAVMAHASDRRGPEAVHKVLRPIRADGGEVPISVVEAQNVATEAAFVALEAKRLMADGSAGVRTLGALCRSGKQADEVEKACLSAGVPYQKVGRTGFYNRTEVRDALAYLRVFENPWDATSLQRVMNRPARGIGDATIKAFSALVGEASQRAVWRAHEHAAGSGSSKERPPSALTCLLAFLPDEELQAGLGAVLRERGDRLAALRAEARWQELGLDDEDDEEGNSSSAVRRAAAATTLAEDPLLRSLLDPAALAVARGAMETTPIPGRSVSALTNFARIMAALAAQACEQSVPALLSEVLYGESVRLAEWAAYDGPRRARLRNLLDIADAGYEASGPAWGGTLGVFLEEAAFMSAEEDEEDGGGGGDGGEEGKTLKIMTVHKAKGLEFDAVFVPGVDSGTYYGRDATQQEEERRTFYVAATRAKTRLCLSYRRRALVGGIWRDVIPCPYLTELPVHICGFLKQDGPRGGFYHVPCIDRPQRSPSFNSKPAWIRARDAARQRRGGGRAGGWKEAVPTGGSASSLAASSLLPRGSAEALLAAEDEAALKGRMRVMMEGRGEDALKRNRARTQAKARAREATRLKRALKEEDDAAQAGAKTDVWTLSSVRALSSSSSSSSSFSSSTPSASPISASSAAAKTAQQERATLPSSIRQAVMTAAVETEGKQQEGAERESRIQDLKAKLTALEEEEKDSAVAAASSSTAPPLPAPAAAMAVPLSSSSLPPPPPPPMTTTTTIQDGPFPSSSLPLPPSEPVVAFSQEAVTAISSASDSDIASRAPRTRGRPRKDTAGNSAVTATAGAAVFLSAGGGVPPPPPPKPQLPRGVQPAKTVQHPTWGQGTVAGVRKGGEAEVFEVDVEFVIGTVTLGPQEASRLVVVDDA